MSATPRLKLPYITPGQAQKDLSHNEALRRIDMLVAPAVETPPVNEPPANAAPGECYIVGAEPSGDWDGRANSLAGYSDSGWRFIDPEEGVSVFVKSAGIPATFRDGSWEVGALKASQLLIGDKQVVGSRAPGIASPARGKTIDAEARAALNAILDALRAHGLIET